MNTCQTCRHWLPFLTARPDYKNPGAMALGGYCRYSLKITEDIGRDSYSSDALVYPYNEGVEFFWTGKDFGCVHHSE